METDFHFKERPVTKGHRHIAMLVALAVLLFLASWYLSRPEPIKVITAVVERGTVEATVANTRAGTVKACRRAGLAPAIGGQIADLPVKEGDRVTTGQLILSLWNDNLRAQVDLAEREASAARARAEASCLQADIARRDAERLQKLGQSHAVAEEQVDAAVTKAKVSRADCSAAQASAEVSQARLGVARAQLERTILRAPFDGVIAEINGELSEYVTPSPPGIATLPAIDLIDDTCFYITAPIDEVDAPAIRAGMPARISLDAFAGERFRGQVRRIANFVRERAKQARTVDVEVAFSDASETARLLAGYSADAEIILSQRANTLRIPTEAVMEASQVMVFNADDETLEKRTIETGLANWDWTEVSGGLQEGEQVVTSLDRPGVEDGAYAVAE